MEKNMENEMETGIMQGLMGIRIQGSGFGLEGSNSINKIFDFAGLLRPKGKVGKKYRSPWCLGLRGLGVWGVRV